MQIFTAKISITQVELTEEKTSLIELNENVIGLNNLQYPL